MALIAQQAVITEDTVTPPQFIPLYLHNFIFVVLNRVM